MNLANHAAALNSSRGAAFGFASIAKLAGEQLAPYVPPLVPKLYRCGLSFQCWTPNQLSGLLQQPVASCQDRLCGTTALCLRASVCCSLMRLKACAHSMAMFILTHI